MHRETVPVFYSWSPTCKRAPQQIAAIRLANALADRCQVYLCNARPVILSPAVAARVDDRIILLEGTLGISSWTFGEGSARDGAAFEAALSSRVEVIEELVRFHKIDVIHSHGWWAHRLVYAVNRGQKLPWLISLPGDTENDTDNPERDPAFDRLVGPMLSTIHEVRSTRILTI